MAWLIFKRLISSRDLGHCPSEENIVQSSNKDSIMSEICSLLIRLQENPFPLDNHLFIVSNNFAS